MSPRATSRLRLMSLSASLLAMLAGSALAQEPRRAAESADGAGTAAPAGTLVLDTVVVEGGAGSGQPPATGTIGQPSAPFAGGDVASGARLGILGNRSIFDTPFSVTSFTDKLIRDQQARTVADVVLNDPSVRNDAPAFSERDAFFIRGFSVVNLDTAYDGLFYIANPRRSFLEGIERVEVLKGPSALLNGGTGRVGGTINLIPKRATDEPLTRLTTTYLSDTQVWTHMDVGRRWGAEGEWGIRVNGSYRDGDTALDRNEQEVGVASLGLDYRGDRLRASLDVNYSDQKIDAPTSLFNAAAPGIRIPRAPNGRINTSNSFEYIDSVHAMAAGRIEYDILDNTTLYAAGGASRYREDFLTSSYLINDPSGNATASLAIQPQQIEGITGEVGLRSRFETGPVGHQLNLSAAQARNENDRGGFARIVLPTFRTNIYDPSFLPEGSVDSSAFPRASGRPRFADIELTSLALSDTLSVMDERVQLTLGGRYQDIRSRAYSTVPGPTLGNLTYDYQDAEFSPAVAAVVRLTDEVSVYGNYIEALTEGPTAPVRARNANEIFAPVVSKQKEIGVKVDLGSVGLTTSLFEIRQPSGFTDPATNVFSVGGLQVNRGLEINLFGEPLDGVRLLGGITLLDAELERTAGGLFDGNTVPGVARTAINLYGEYDVTWLTEGLTLTGRMVHTGSTFYDQANNQTIDDWTRVDLGARYAFTGPYDKEVEVRANVENVFDETYWASSARGFLAAGAPRTFLVSTSIDF
ncbi:TonB-dependent receptor [Antarcticirhabdus aurantiaca]|uniref:TonB-dependent siderophore receptor n=1 Tax=Antarcticirhabdus aurantiaca TaxID=2606717 RepID=A0ACD4NMC1_9HYPH|nr:TonB-dependent siderophore receptor [Antarcticirhabdus aurantiaca]WAJ27984.1 TonB-dependent siderophore receptor [Jeongeuplla avenae]